MERHTDNVQNLLGDAVAGVTITVRLHDTSALASIFSDNLVVPTVKANPFTNDTDGEFFFYAANETYDIVLTGPISETREAVELTDPADQLVSRLVLVGAAAGPTAITLGQVLLVDVTANAVTLTLPPDPGASVQFPDIIVQHVAGDATVNNITVQRNGELIGGVAADVVISTLNGAFRFIWAGSTLGWAIQAT